MDGSVPVDAATCAPALCAAIEGGLGIGLIGREERLKGASRKGMKKGMKKGILKGMKKEDEEGDSVGVAVRDALARAHAGDGVNLGGRLRFLAGRALAALESADAARGVGGRKGGGEQRISPFNRRRTPASEVR